MYCTEKHRGLLLFKSSKHSRQIEINGYFLNNFLCIFQHTITKYTHASKGFFKYSKVLEKGCLVEKNCTVKYAGQEF